MRLYCKGSVKLSTGLAKISYSPPRGKKYFLQNHCLYWDLSGQSILLGVFHIFLTILPLEYVLGILQQTRTYLKRKGTSYWKLWQHLAWRYLQNRMWSLLFLNLEEICGVLEIFLWRSITSSILECQTKQLEGKQKFSNTRGSLFRKILSQNGSDRNSRTVGFCYCHFFSYETLSQVCFRYVSFPNKFYHSLLQK